LPVNELEDHTILNLSPTAFTRAVFGRMGFVELERRIVLIPAIYPTLGPPGYSMTTDPDVIERSLGGDDLRIFNDHRRYPCTHLLFQGPHDYSYVVAGRTRFRRLPTTFIYYRSNPRLFRALLGRTQLALSRAHRTAFTIIDRRLCGEAPLRGCPSYELSQPRLFRRAKASSLRAEDIDTLYSEFVVLNPGRWTFNS